MKNLGEKGKSKFSFLRTQSMRKAKVDLARDDMLINYTTEETILMNEKIPWRGAREKDPRFFQFLIEGTTIEGDLVVDCTASTGMFGFQ